MQQSADGILREATEQQQQAREVRAQAWMLHEFAEELAWQKVRYHCKYVMSTSRLVRGGERPRSGGPRTSSAHRNWPRSSTTRGGPRALQLAGRAGIPRRRRRVVCRGRRQERWVGAPDEHQPDIIRFYCGWLRSFFDIDEVKLRVWLYLHEGLPLRPAIDHWSEITAIPDQQFKKPYRAKGNAQIRKSSTSSVV